MHIAFDPMIAFLAGIALALVAALMLELYNSRRISNLSAPMYEYAVKKAENEAAHILEDAQQKARDIIATAEAKSLSLTADRAKDAEGAEKRYEETLTKMLHDSQAHLEESVQTLKEKQDALSATLVDGMKKEEADAKQRIAADLAAMTAEHKKRLDGAFEETLQAAKEDAAAYEQARIAAIDEHIFAIVKDAVKISLRKALPPEAHADLVRAALEEAKEQKVF